MGPVLGLGSGGLRKCENTPHGRNQNHSFSFWFHFPFSTGFHAESGFESSIAVEDGVENCGLNRIFVSCLFYKSLDIIVRLSSYDQSGFERGTRQLRTPTAVQEKSTF